MAKIIWKDVPGYEGRYIISNRGKLRSVTRQVKSRGGYHTVKQKTIGTYINNSGYFIGALGRDGGTKGIHRIVAMAFLPKPSNRNMQINHKNGDKLDNRPENLEWVTRSQNIRHRIDMFSIGLGESNGRHKLTGKSVKKIRYLYRTRKKTQDQLSDMFKVSQTQIGRIVNKIRWKHL
jgi:hypothetical protein